MGQFFARDIRSSFIYLSGNVLTASGDRLYINGNPIALLSEITGGSSGVLTGDYYLNSNPSGFESSVSYSYELPSGQDSIFIPYPVSLSSTPKAISCEISNDIDSYIYCTSLSGVSISGFYVNLSDNTQASGYNLLVSVNK